MSLTDKFAQLDGEIRELFDKALQEHREGLKQRLREGQEELLRSLEETPPTLPAGLVDSTSLTAAVKSESQSEAQQTFLSTLRRFDRCQSQTEVLQALVDESEAFAPRRAIFLTRGDEATGWGGSGWTGHAGNGDAGSENAGTSDDAIRGTSIQFDKDEGWAELQTDASTITLGSARCAALCSRLEAPVPQEGVIIPLILRDRIAAALYADRPSGDDTFDIPALQVLVYLAAQSIETLAFRDRAATPSLWLKDDVPEGLPSLALWDGAAPPAEAAPTTSATPPEEIAQEDATQGEAAQEDQEDEIEAAPEAVTPEPVTPEPVAAESGAVETPASPTEDSAPESGIQAIDIPAPPPAEPAEPAAAESEAAPEPVAKATGDSDSEAPIVAPSDAPSVDPVDPGPALEELKEMDLADADSSFWSMPEEVAAVDQTLIGASQPAQTPQPAETPASPEELFEEDEVPVEPPPISSTLELGNVDLEAIRKAHDQNTQGDGTDASIEGASSEGASSGDDSGEVAAEAAPPQESASAPAEAPAAAASEMGQETVMIDRSRFATAFGDPPPAAAPPEDPKDSTLASGAQVVPPQDVDGPGWAFASLDGGSGNDTAGDAEHEEARRLARLLVSEIRLYNEEQVEEGRRHSDIYRRLKDDIDRSRQMYRERVSQDISDSTDYFQQELVRILGAGDSNALGM